MRPDLTGPRAVSALPDLASVTTLLCDADGNLFPSEGPAFDASVEVTNRFLATIGSELRYTAEELRRAALGRNFRSLAADLAAQHGDTVPAEDLLVWVQDEATAVTRHLASVLVPHEQTTRALRALGTRYRLAVVSSSASRRLDACFRATGLDELFPPADRFSAQDSLPVPTSKPDPAVYRHALQRLDVRPAQALAVEDAPAGVLSAVAAGITTIGNLVHVPATERVAHGRELREAGAAAVVDDWDGLCDLVGVAPGDAR